MTPSNLVRSSRSASAILSVFTIVSLISVLAAPSLASAAATVNPANGGTNISIDTTFPSGSGAYKSLTGPSFGIENGDVAIGTHTITLPTGWEFDTNSSITIAAFNDIVLDSATVVPNQTSFSFAVTSQSTSAGSIGFIGLKVRPTTTTPSTGNMAYSGAGIAGVDGTTNFGTLTSVAGTPVELKIENSATGGTEIDTATVSSGSPLTLYSNTRDQFGNFVANVAITWSLTGSSGGILDGDLVPAGDTKSAVFTGSLVGTTVVQAADSFTDTTGVITVVPGPVSAEDSTVATDTETKVVSSGGQVITVTVTAKDAAGNPISGKTASIDATGTGNTISPATATTNESGVAVFTISSTKAEAKTITATVDDEPITSSTPNVTFTHDVASQLAIATQPSTTATAGVAFVQQPVVRVLDQFGNLINDDDTTVITAARNSGTGTDDLQGTLTATVSDGVASFLGLNYQEAVTSVLISRAAVSLLSPRAPSRSLRMFRQLPHSLHNPHLLVRWTSS